MKATPGNERANGPWRGGEGGGLGREPADADLQIEIARMRRQIKELGGISGGPLNGAPPLDPVMEATFLRNVLAFETAPETTLAALLQRDGIEVPPPAAFPEDADGDAALHGKLWEVIRGLAARNVFLEHTDHLSDRALYEWLVTDPLGTPTPDLGEGSDFHEFIDVLGGGSDEDRLLMLRYYADDTDRDFWSDDLPADQIPDHEDPPFDRDRHLPGGFLSCE